MGIREAYDKIAVMHSSDLRLIVTEIFDALNGQEWDSETCSTIAESLSFFGLIIQEPE